MPCTTEPTPKQNAMTASACCAARSLRSTLRSQMHPKSSFRIAHCARDTQKAYVCMTKPE